MSVHALAWTGIALLVVALALVSFTLAATPVAPVAELGLRGWRRQEALASPAWRLFEPWVRWLAAFFRRLPLGNLRYKANRQLMWAGDYLGLDADGWFATIALGGIIGGLASSLARVVSPELPDFMSFVMVGAGIWGPYWSVPDTINRRRRMINRNLPGAMDILALCLSAGMTFPQALREYVDRSTVLKDALIEELRQVLRHISLGHGHSYALDILAMRVPVDAVRDFVGAVAQSEQKGTPLADVIATQANLLRMRRSVIAEEAAARAGSLMVIPLSLMMVTNLIVVVGPLVVKGMIL